MKIVVSAQGDNLDAPASPVFGRCPTYVFVDTDTLAFEALPNPAISEGGGAGIQAAQF
ncbi:MAG: dinitrogenase iron-molybdenum cofactor biosynthesis protein, partial [Chloroflexi bacterium]|nr:dinitrogenase iron-molybdenum cofactor biosynthesis protein [Chloroflexota bacterium]